MAGISTDFLVNDTDLTSRKLVLRGAGGTSTANIIKITLNKGETYVFAIKSTDSTLNRNQGMIGGLITSNKNIAVNTVSWGGNLANANLLDIGLDQREIQYSCEG